MHLPNLLSALSLAGAAMAASNATLMAKQERRQAAAVSPDCAIAERVFGTFWTSQTNTAGDDCCAWRAFMTCDAGNPRRIQSFNFDVEQSHLNKPLSTEIGLFTEVTQIALPHNGITGSIPTEIGLLKKLAVLDLSANSISGNIPTEIGALTLLTNLYLNNNVDLTGPIPTQIANFKSLEMLELANCSLTGSFPPDILNIKSLAYWGVSIDPNLLTGPIPTNPNTAKFKNWLPLHNCFDCMIGSDRNPKCPTPGTACVASTSGSAVMGPTGSAGNATNTAAPVVAPPPPQSGPPVAAIAGGAAGAVVVIGLIVAAVVYNKKRQQPEPEASKAIEPAQAFALPPKYVDPVSLPPSSRGSIMPPYAASGSSGSVSGDVRVDQYNVFAAKAPLPSDIRSSTLTGTYSTGGDEKLSEKARMAAGENESSFLNNSFAGTGSVRSGPTNLDEKTFLRMNQQQQPPRPEAGPLPEKDTFAFQSGAAAAASAAASQPNRDPGALPEKDPLLLQLNNSNAGNYGSAAPRFGTAPQTAPGPLRFDDPTQWSVEQCEAWARKIASIGEMVALKIREHSITGHLLLKLTRDDMRSDFGLSVADRIILEREIQTLRTNAGLVDVLEEIDATVPPSYNF